MNQLSLTFAIDCANEMRVLLPSPAGRRVGDEGLATKEKTANPVLHLETSESDRTEHWIVTRPFQKIPAPASLRWLCRVLRFSNDQILNDTENVLREITAYL